MLWVCRPSVKTVFTFCRIQNLNFYFLSDFDTFILMFILTSAPVICQWILGSSYSFELKGPKWGRISKFFQTFIFCLILTKLFFYIYIFVNDRLDECSITDQAITIFNFPMSTYCGCIMLFWRTPSVKHEPILLSLQRVKKTRLHL